MISIYKKLKLIGKNYDKWLVTLIDHIDDEYVLKKLNLTEMIYMNWLVISCDDDKGVV